MAGYSAVSDVSKTLVNVLKEGMVDPEQPEVPLVDKNSVGLASPADASDQTLRLTVYLYKVEENGHMKNADRREITATQYERPPLALDLYYLLTAHPATATDGENDTADPQVILGRAMQILHDETVLGGDEDDEETYVSLYSRSIDEIANLFPDESFWPSVSYLATPVVIESTKVEEAKPVVERQIGRPQKDGGE